MPLRAAELEVLITANDQDVARAEKSLKSSGQRIEKNPVTQKVEGDEKAAVAAIGRVAADAKKLVSERTVATVDANIDRATKSVDRVQARLDYLRSVETDLDVSADIARAEANLSKLERQRDALVSARSKLEVIADTGSAESNVKRLGDTVVSEGKSAGERGGRTLSESLDSATRGAGEAVGSAVGGDIEDTLVNALTAIPIVGGIILAAVGIGKAISGAIQDGLQVEVGYDRLQALTGLDPAQTLRIGRAAGEAYADAFGASIESNMDTARLAVQFDLIDENATTRDAQKVVEALAGISDVLGEDVRPVATAVTTLLRTGLVKSSQDAFDLIAAGARNGVNRFEDMLDTLTEYPVAFQRLGLSGGEALGLINQGMQAGARNSDLVADALKELQIRATDASATSAQGYQIIGLNAEDMTAKMAVGGSSAREGLDLILDGLRAIEDPVAQNAAGVALMGAKWEDMGAAVLALDLSTAEASLNGVTGSAQRMFETLAGNDATKIESAKRNVEVAMDGIKGAIAAGFSEPLADAADWISQNRGPVMQFFLDLANGALDFGESVVMGMAEGTESLGMFVSGPLADFVYSVADVLGKLPWPFNQDTSALKESAEQMRGFEDTTTSAAGIMRTEWIATIEEARSKMNEFGQGAVDLGYLNDAALRTADAMSQVGYAIDGSRLSLDGLDLSNLRASDSGKTLESQIRAGLAALNDEITAATTAGESQENLTDRYNAATDALVGQMMQMGLTEDQARSLIDTVLQTPPEATTFFGSNAVEEQGRVQNLATRIETLPDGSVVIVADTSPADASMRAFWDRWNNGEISVTVRQQLSYAVNSGSAGSIPRGAGHDGGVVEFMARGGFPDLVPMGRIASMVSPNTWRVVGDRGDVPEAFIPMDGSPRSHAILAAANRMMPGWGASGNDGVVAALFALISEIREMPRRDVNQTNVFQQTDPTLQARAAGRELREVLASS